MKIISNIIISVVSIMIVLALGYFLTPMNAWKAYKEKHPVLFSTQDASTPTYKDFCKSYWKTFFKTEQNKEEDITYDGGEWPELTVTP